MRCGSFDEHGDYHQPEGWNGFIEAKFLILIYKHEDWEANMLHFHPPPHAEFWNSPPTMYIFLTPVDWCFY
jgi:hypothetical protein